MNNLQQNTEVYCCICYQTPESQIIDMDFFLELLNNDTGIVLIMNDYVKCMICKEGIYCIECLLLSLSITGKCSTCKTSIQEVQEDSLEYESEYYQEYDSEEEYLQEYESEEDSEEEQQIYFGVQEDQSILYQKWLNQPHSEFSCQRCFQSKKLFNTCINNHFLCLLCILDLDEIRSQQNYIFQEHYTCSNICIICNAETSTVEDPEFDICNQTASIDQIPKYDLNTNQAQFVIQCIDYNSKGQQIQNLELVLNMNINYQEYIYLQQIQYFNTKIGQFICNITDISNLTLSDFKQLLDYWMHYTIIYSLTTSYCPNIVFYYE